MENIDIINKLVDKQARNLVGILCKRVEVLEKENKLTPSLYKSLAKELIYESFRNLKEFIFVYTNVGKLVFKSKNKSD